MLVREDHGLHNGNFGDGELARAGSGARRAIVEGTGCGGTAPGMVASRFEAKNPEDHAKGEPRPGVLDGTEDVRLGGAVRQSSAAEVEPGHGEQSQQETNDGGENPSSAVEPGDGIQELLPVLLQGLDGDDGADAAPPPGRDRGTGDGEAVAQRPGTGMHHVLAQTMVVGAARARFGRRDGLHRRRIVRPQGPREGNLNDLEDADVAYAKLGNVHARSCADSAWACDFIQGYDILFRQVYAFFIVHLGSRKVVYTEACRHPTQEWTAQQLRNATMDGDAPTILLRDRDDKYGPSFGRVAKGAGIRVIKTAVQAPNMNAVADRFVGSVRRELLDHVIVLDDQHLGRLVREYREYFNDGDRRTVRVRANMPQPANSVHLRQRHVP
jgi:transposase InsO family protein